MDKNEWILKCQHWKKKWPVINDSHLPSETDLKINIYAVIDVINKFSTPNDVIMGDAGSISYVGPVALEAKPNQRFIFSPSQADMGWALPASIGVSLASKQPVIAIIGDGSFMSNLQELAVVKEHNLDIKFIILNNNGYLSIKNTQSRFFEGRVHGTSVNTGLWFPSFKNVAQTFGLDFYDVRTKQDLEHLGKVLLPSRGPMIIDVQCLEDQQILPAQTFKNGKQAGLHDMAPFLSDEEMREETIIKELLTKEL